MLYLGMDRGREGCALKLATKGGEKGSNEMRFEAMKVDIVGLF
jgi:hypothetical protein